MSTHPCQACGGVRPPEARFAEVADPQSADRFAVQRCTVCGVGHTSPEPDDLSAYYGPLYYGNRHGITARYCSARRRRILSRARKAPGNLLDIGCGDGTFLVAATRDGWKVTGTEVGGAAEISKKAGIRVRSSIDDIGDLAPFDAITMWHTLEHFRDPRSIVARVHDSLAEGGTFIVAVPNAQGLQAKVFRENWFHLDVPRHLYHFDEGSLGALLETSGLRVLNWRHLEIEIDLFGWVQSALNAALPHQPNALFQSLTGKPRTTGLGPLALSYVLGSVLGPLALAGTALGALTGRGATITAVAERV